MNKTLSNVLHWSPRILAIVFAAFISLFALDIFDLGLGFWETLLGLFMHLIPTFLIIIALVLAWRWAWAGVSFVAIGAFMIVQFGQGWDVAGYVLLAGPLFLLGLLFLADWFNQRKMAAAM